METDSELLQRFSGAGNGSAFRELVERHAGRVHGAALRITASAAMAEEITQAVFTVLARKAGRLSSRENLAGWLHNAAVLEARNAMRKSARYLSTLSHYHEEMNASSASSSPENAPWREISPWLDEALSRLPEGSRNLVLMRFYEGRSLREIAAWAGKSEEASRKEIDRSVQRLASFLKRRGILTSGAALSAVLSAQTLCVPPAAAASVIAAAAVQSALPVLGAASLLGRAALAVKSPGAVQTAAAALALAAVPAGYLWVRAGRLEAEVTRLRAGLALASASAASAPRPSSPPFAVLTAAADSGGGSRPAAPGSRPQGAGQAQTQGPPPFFKAEHLIRRMREEAGKNAALETVRLGLNIPSLTEDQKQRVREAVERAILEKADLLEKALRAGIIARAVTGRDSLTEEDRAVLAAAAGSPGKEASAAEGTLRAILAPSQQEEYTRAREIRRVSDAETVAADALKSLGRNFDLSPAQRDQIFQALAQHELAEPEDSREEGGLPFLPPGAAEEARNRIILENLTPAQAAVYHQVQEEEKKGREQFLREFLDPR